MGFIVAAGALGELFLEPLVLLVGIVELAEGVAELESADEELEALDMSGSSGFALESGETTVGSRR